MICTKSKLVNWLNNWSKTKRKKIISCSLQVVLKVLCLLLQVKWGSGGGFWAQEWCDWVDVFLFFVFNFFNVCLFVRETEYEWGRGRERETQNQKQAPRLRAVSAESDAGLERTNREIMTWVEVGCLTNWATQGPPQTFLIVIREDYHHLSKSIGT